MAGSAVVTTTIRLVGEDRASAEINKAKQAVEETSHSLKAAGAEAEGMGGSINEMAEGGGRKIEILGSLARPLAGMFGEAGAQIREMGHGMHAAVYSMELLGGPLAAIGLAVGGIAVGALLWRNHLKEVHEATEKLEGAFKDLGLPIEDVDGMVEAVRQRAEDFGRDGDKAAKLFRKGMEGDKKAVDDLFKSMGQALPADAFMHALGFKAAAKSLESVKDEVNKFTLTYQAAANTEADVYAKLVAQRTALSKGTNFERIQARATDINQDPELVAAHKKTEELLKIKQKAENELYNLTADANSKRQTEEIRKDNEDVAREHEASNRVLKAVVEGEHKKAEAWAAARKKSAEAAKREHDKEEATRAAQARKHMDNVAKDEATLAEILQASLRKTEELTVQAAKSPAEKARLENIDIEKQKLLDLAKIRNAMFADENKQKLAMDAVEKRVEAEHAKVERDRLAAIQKEDKARDDMHKKAMKAAADAAKADQKKTQGQIDDAFRWAGVVKQAGEIMGASKREMALLDGLISTADAIKLAYSQDYVGAVEAGFAAAAYFTAAASSGSSTASPATGASSGGYAPGASSGSTSGNGGGGQVININFSGTSLVTRAEIGQAVTQVVGATRGTGYSGKGV